MGSGQEKTCQNSDVVRQLPISGDHEKGIVVGFYSTKPATYILFPGSGSTVVTASQATGKEPASGSRTLNVESRPGRIETRRRE